MRTLLGKRVTINNGIIQEEKIKDKLKKQFKTKEPIIEEVVEEVIEDTPVIEVEELIEDINVVETEERMSIEDKIVDEALKRMGL